MPAPARRTRPWGEAIAYWLRERNWSQADLVRESKKKKNTISRAVRGWDVSTKTLAAIANAFGVRIELVLVSPEWINRQDSQRRIIQDAVSAALTAYEAHQAAAMPLTTQEREARLDADLHQLVKDEDAREQGKPQQDGLPLGKRKQGRRKRRGHR